MKPFPVFSARVRGSPLRPSRSSLLPILLGLVVSVAGSSSLSSSCWGAAPAISPLPAGDYFRPWYSTCPWCPRPNVAVVAGIFDSDAEAAAVVARIPAGLPFGYPLVLHSAELGLADRTRAGVVVVVGLFGDVASARSWRDARGAAFPPTSLQALMSEEAFSQSLAAKLNPGTPPKSVVRIAPGAPVPAFTERELVKLGEGVAWRRSHAKPSHPVCLVPPGAIFTVGEADFQFTYRWAPVRCGAELAYVAWEKTMHKSTVVPAANETFHLVQVTDIASEDEPVYSEWLFDADGRHPLPRGLASRRFVHGRLGTKLRRAITTKLAMQFGQDEAIHIAEPEGAINRHRQTWIDVESPRRRRARGRRQGNTPGAQPLPHLLDRRGGDLDQQVDRQMDGHRRLAWPRADTRRSPVREDPDDGHEQEAAACDAVSKEIRFACSTERITVEAAAGTAARSGHQRAHEMAWVCRPGDEVDLADTPLPWTFGKATCLQMIGGKGHPLWYETCAPPGL